MRPTVTYKNFKPQGMERAARIACAVLGGFTDNYMISDQGYRVLVKSTRRGNLILTAIHPEDEKPTE